MTVRENGTRYIRYCDWGKVNKKPYDYEREGLLKKIMSPTIINNRNSITKIILEYFEKSLIFAMKYTDILNNFKNIHWKNR